MPPVCFLAGRISMRLLISYANVLALAPPHLASRIIQGGLLRIWLIDVTGRRTQMLVRYGSNNTCRCQVQLLPQLVETHSFFRKIWQTVYTSCCSPSRQVRINIAIKETKRIHHRRWSRAMGVNTDGLNQWKTHEMAQRIRGSRDKPMKSERTTKKTTEQGIKGPRCNKNSSCKSNVHRRKTRKGHA